MSALEPDSRAFKATLALVTTRLTHFLDTLATQPAARTEGGAKLARRLAEPLPERPSTLRNALRILFDQVVPTALHTSGPGYMAYIPGGGLPLSAVADLISGVTNRYVGLWMAAPGLVQLEINVLRWFCGIVGYGADAGGILTSGGSIANLTALVTARRERLPEDFLSGIVYCTAHAHHSVKKAALLAGFPVRNVREVAMDAAFRMDAHALQAQVRRDRADGLTPFCVVASAGTTAVGAVDPLTAIADIAQVEGLWLHVDAAYGGFFAMTEAGRRILAGIERADSITLDPHKGLFLPYGTGCILVRDRDALRRAHAVSAEYLPPPQTHSDRWDFAEMGPELSRDARGLRVWLPIKVAGAAAFRTQLQEKLDLATFAAESIRALPEIEIVVEPTLSLFAFRVVGDEAATHRLLAAVNQRGRVFLTGVPLAGGFVIRVCVLSFRTHAREVAFLLEDVAASLPSGPSRTARH